MLKDQVPETVLSVMKSELCLCVCVFKKIHPQFMLKSVGISIPLKNNKYPS